MYHNFIFILLILFVLQRSTINYRYISVFHFLDTLCPSESARAIQRNLLYAYAADHEDEYVLRENRLANKNFKRNRGNRSVLRSRLGDDADYANQDEDDDDNDSDNDDDDEEGIDNKSGVDDEKDDENDEDEEDEENRDEMVNESEAARYYDYG